MRFASCSDEPGVTSQTVLHCFRDEKTKGKRYATDEDVVGALANAARPLIGASNDYDALLELIGDARLVLLGEATHGTHEFYRERAQITKRLIVEKALPGSYEALLHDAGPNRFFLDLQDERVRALREPRLERAIGVVYRPETERASHYFHANLPAQFNAILHFDQTRAVEPLEPTVHWRQETAETFLSGV